MFKKYFLIYKLVEYITDYGLVFPQWNSNLYFQQDYVERDIYLVGIQTIIPNTYFQFCFTIYSSIYDVYYRNYMTVPQITANVGGALNTLFIFSLILNYYFEKKFKELEIFNICCKNIIHNKMKKEINLDHNKIKSDLEFSKIENISNYEDKPKAHENSDIISVKFTKKNLNDISKSSFKNSKCVEKNVSIIFQNISQIEDVSSLEVNFFQILCFLKRNEKIQNKIQIANEFSNQIFDVTFLFGNILETQFNFNLLLPPIKNIN